MSSKRISHPFSERDRRLLQSSTSFSTAIAKLTACNGEPDDNFGFNKNNVAISNNRIVVGADGYNNDQGAAYVFTDPNDPSTGRSYSQMAILVVSDAQSGHSFGWSIDIDGDIIVVGAIDAYTGGSEGPGAVYVFRILSNNSISQIAKITAQNGATDDQFGFSVVIRGNFIMVGANGVKRNGFSFAGTAYLFVNPSNDPTYQEWTQIMQFQPNDLTETDNFGFTVAMDDQIAVVGTEANAAYIFSPVDENFDSLSSWTQVAKLTGTTNSTFGYSVAVAGNSIVVGTPVYVKNGGNDVGAVFVFSGMDDSTSSSSWSWTQTNILLAADGAGGDWFGVSVSISKDASTIVVGANDEDYNSTIVDSGATYLFRNSYTTTTTGWTQVGKYVAADRDSYDFLGLSIAIENSIVVVGAYGSVHILDTGYSSLLPTTPAPIDTTSVPTKSDNNNNNNIIIAVMVVFGVVVVALGIGFFFCRLKKDRLRLIEQQQQQQIMHPSLLPPSSGNRGVVVVNMTETPVMADVIFPPTVQSTQDMTMEAELLVDPPQTHAPFSTRTVSLDVTDAEIGFRHFKDQARTVIPPRPSRGPSGIPSPEPIMNSHRNRDQEESLTRKVQQQLPDPPATTN